MSVWDFLKCKRCEAEMDEVGILCDECEKIIEQRTQRIEQQMQAAGSQNERDGWCTLAVLSLHLYIKSFLEVLEIDDDEDDDGDFFDTLHGRVFSDN